MNAVHEAPAQAPYLLFDAGALTEDECRTLRAAGTAIWVYADLGESDAARVGPVCVPDGEPARTLAAALAADDARAWATARIEHAGDRKALARHLRRARYLHTHDGQRYFFRYADTRCLAAMWPVLTPAQRDALLGPIAAWSFADRDGQPVRLHRAAGNGPFVRLRLTAAQLGALLDASLPDQLLASALQKHPLWQAAGAPRERYRWASRLCAHLRAAGVQRYPVQFGAIEAVLSTQGAALDRPDLDHVLARAQREPEFDVVAALTGATEGGAVLRAADERESAA